MKKYLLFLFSGAMVMTMASCSMFQKNVKTEAQLPTDRTTITNGQQKSQPYRSQALERGELSGDWAIETVGGTKASGETPPYIRFDNANKRIYGNNGCNSINADYTINPETKQLHFGHIVTTMRYCAGENISETQINMALNTTASYSWERNGSRYSITLYSSEGNALMTLVHQEYDFLNGTWAVERLGDKKVDNDEMKLVFDIAEMKVHGNTGCNILNGALVTDMLEADAISFQNMATTRRMCPDIQLETELLVALEATSRVKPVNANTVNVLDNKGKVILQLVRTTDQ